MHLREILDERRNLALADRGGHRHRIGEKQPHCRQIARTMLTRATAPNRLALDDVHWVGEEQPDGRHREHDARHRDRGEQADAEAAMSGIDLRSSTRRSCSHGRAPDRRRWYQRDSADRTTGSPSPSCARSLPITSRSPTIERDQPLGIEVFGGRARDVAGGDPLDARDELHEVVVRQIVERDLRHGAGDLFGGLEVARVAARERGDAERQLVGGDRPRAANRGDLADRLLDRARGRRRLDADLQRERARAAAGSRTTSARRR